MTTKNSENSAVFMFHRMLYALQVIILALAIPLLSYVELSHNDQDQNLPNKGISNKMTIKPGVIAFNPIIK